MSSTALESDDLLNVRLVRMEDVQPSRNLLEIESCVINNLVFDNECVVNDEDSNIGSMVSIHSEDIIDGSDGDIVTEIVEPLEMKKELEDNLKTASTDSWPTLEILPGGFIKHANKREEDVLVPKSKNKPTKCKEMMYACAKCSQSFKYLFSLVKHVKSHEDEQKKHSGVNSSKLKKTLDKDVYQQSSRKKSVKLKSNKRKVPKRRKP